MSLARLHFFLGCGAISLILVPKGFTHGYNVWVVNEQQRNRHAPNRRPRFQPLTIPGKVFRPPITAGVEQANDLSAIWIESSNVRPLEAITVNAGKGKVIQRRQSAMLEGDNVIDLEWRGMKRGRQLAIFATRLGSLPDLADEIGVQRNR